MKHLLISALLVGAFFQAVSQKRPTTMEEYKYITMAYREDIKSGRDIKAGYYTAFERTETKDGLEIKAVKFFRTSDQSYVGTYIRVKGRDKDLCLPSDPGRSSEPFKMFRQELKSLGPGELTSVTIFLLDYLADYEYLVLNDADLTRKLTVK